MPFESLFRESKGGPVQYKGETIVLVDRFVIAQQQTFTVLFESSNKRWRQGVMLNFEGQLEVEGQRCPSPIVLWTNTAPRRVRLIATRQTEVVVRNVWDVGDGTIQSWHNGAAMKVQVSGQIRRYLCNDGFDDDDFEDLKFAIEIESR